MSTVIHSPSLAGIPTLQLPFFPPKPGSFLFSCFPIPPSFSFILTFVFLIHYFRILINFRCSSQVQEFQIDFLGCQIPLVIAARELDCSSVLGSQCVLQILLRSISRVEPTQGGVDMEGEQASDDGSRREGMEHFHFPT